MSEIVEPFKISIDEIPRRVKSKAVHLLPDFVIDEYPIFFVTEEDSEILQLYPSMLAYYFIEVTIITALSDTKSNKIEEAFRIAEKQKYIKDGFPTQKGYEFAVVYLHTYGEYQCGVEGALLTIRKFIKQSPLKGYPYLHKASNEVIAEIGSYVAVTDIGFVMDNDYFESTKSQWEKFKTRSG